MSTKNVVMLNLCVILFALLVTAFAHAIDSEFMSDCDRATATMNHNAVVQYDEETNTEMTVYRRGDERIMMRACIK